MLIHNSVLFRFSEKREERKKIQNPSNQERDAVDNCTMAKDAAVWKCGGNRPSKPAAGRLSEIVNGATSSTYFTERSVVYFYFISMVFQLVTWYLVLLTISLLRR
jgi:hypothetical protein